MRFCGCRAWLPSRLQETAAYEKVIGLRVHVAFAQVQCTGSHGFTDARRLAEACAQHAGRTCDGGTAAQPTVLPEERPAEDVAKEFSRRRQERVWVNGDMRPAAPVEAAAGGAPASPPASPS